jgi:hypothetical protein
MKRAGSRWLMGIRVKSASSRAWLKKNGLNLTIIVDLIHVIEYLWDAARVFHPDPGAQLENWVRYRLLEILRGKAGLMSGGNASKRNASCSDC